MKYRCVFTVTEVETGESVYHDVIESSDVDPAMAARKGFFCLEMATAKRMGFDAEPSLKVPVSLMEYLLFKGAK
jgi:hypothetical protein